jgi:hypothetical protein
VTLSAQQSEFSMAAKRSRGWYGQIELSFPVGTSLDLGKRDVIEKVTIDWPSGRSEEYKNLKAGRAHGCVEGKGITTVAGI